MSIYSDGRYLKENPGWHDEDSPFKAAQVVRAIERTSITFTKVAEVGCGAGQIVRTLAAHYTTARFVGYEISPDAYRLCDTQGLSNLHYVLGDFAAVSERFDLIVSCDVFEHVEDYLGFLRTLAARTRVAIFNIPLEVHVLNVLMQRFDRSRRSVGHLHYFTRETALATLRHVGFDIVDSFLAPGGIALARRWDQKVLLLPRKLFAALSPQLGCRLFGGYSLVVVAHSSHSGV